MPDDDRRISVALSWLFDDHHLPSIASVLSCTGGASTTGMSCRECGGRLWRYDGDLLCEQCSVVSNDSRRSTNDEERRLPNDSSRSVHWNSGRRRCIGGFPHPYAWVDSNESDVSPEDVDPSDFYR